MKLFIVIFVTVLGLSLIPISSAHAQMMGGSYYPTPSVSQSDINSQQQEENEGKDLVDKLNSKSIACSKLSDSDFEKIGEYFMGQTFSGDTAAHVAANNRIKSMMGEQGEEQMHIAWGKRGTGCDTNAQFMPQQGGGGLPMMGWWGYGSNGMMNGAFGVLGFLFWLVGFIDLILFGIWLWQKIKK